MSTVTAQRGPLIPSIGLSILVSVGFFWLMHSVITVTGHGAQKSETLPTIDFVRLKRDTEVETLSRRKPPPPPPEPPPPPQKMQIATSDAVASSASPVPMEMPSLGLSANVSGGPFIGEMGSGSAAPALNGGLFDGDIIPLQRIAPQYPRDAARARINGFVQLEVLVNADGSVRSAKVLGSNPKGLFEAAAVAAVMRWKFKPKVVNGQPVPQRGSQKIEFNINSAA